MVLGALGGSLEFKEVSWGVLGVLVGSLGLLEGPWGSRRVPRGSWRVPGRSLGVKGASWGVLGGSRGHGRSVFIFLGGEFAHGIMKY